MVSADLCFDSYRLYGDVRLVVAFASEGNDTIGQSVQSVVRTHTHVCTGFVYRTALTHDDVTCLCDLSTPDFYTKALAF